LVIEDQALGQKGQQKEESGFTVSPPQERKEQKGARKLKQRESMAILAQIPKPILHPSWQNCEA